MNKKIEKILEDDCKKNGWAKWKNDDELEETIRDYDTIYEEKIESYRWWDICRYVIKVGGIYIGYIYAKTTGDMSPYEAGFEFDLSTVCEMLPVTKTITTYIKATEGENV